MRYTINVTEDDIRKGKATPFDCPIVLAINRLFPNERIQVGFVEEENIEYVIAFNEDKDNLLPLPDVALNWLLDYDSTGAIVNSISFEIERN